jgi:hypothetical protein
MALKVIKTTVDGLTGHIQHVVRLEETVNGQTTHGPEETVGIWPEALMRKFHGPGEATEDSIRQAHRAFLRDHHAGALERKRHREKVFAIAHEVQNKVLEFEGGDDGN